METPINESAVWQRVTAAAQGAAAGGQPGTENAPVGPELLEAMGRKRRDSQSYRRLAARTGGQIQRTLRQLSEQAEREEKTLGALYLFLTGQRGTVKSPQTSDAEGRESNRDVLRRMMQRAELSAGRYEALANRTSGEVRLALMELAEAERSSFHTLLRLLREYV